MRDLELRGAGNLLGSQQHGQMESVGYDLYLKLLAQAVREEKGEQAPPEEAECIVDIRTEARIPDGYIPYLRQRLDMYRRIANIRTDDDVSDVIDELVDRYGEPPEPVSILVDIARLRVIAASHGISEIRQTDTDLLLTVTSMDVSEYTEYAKRLAPRTVRMREGASEGTMCIVVRLKDRERASDAMTDIIEALEG